jgi:Flp pilus assembly protein TadG
MTVRAFVAWWRSDQGSVAAEASLVAPFLVMLLVFVAVFVHRGVDVRIRIDDAAHQAARAASIEHSLAAATSAAESTATAALTAAGVLCRPLSVHTTTHGMRLDGGSVSVTLSCDVDVSEALLIGIPGTKRLSASAIEPVDIWRSTPDPGSQT